MNYKKTSAILAAVNLLLFGGCMASDSQQRVRESGTLSHVFSDYKGSSSYHGKFSKKIYPTNYNSATEFTRKSVKNRIIVEVN